MPDLDIDDPENEANTKQAASRFSGLATVGLRRAVIERGLSFPALRDRIAALIASNHLPEGLNADAIESKLDRAAAALTFLSTVLPR